MASYIPADLVRETTSTTGTGTYTLAGAVLGYQAFSAVMATADTCFYAVKAGSSYEIGIGTFTSPDQLARTTVIESSNADLAVSWGAGVKNIYITTPAALAGWLNHLEQSIASATTTDLGSLKSSSVLVTGTVNITSFGTAANQLKFVRFAAALEVTYNATTLLLPGGRKMVTEAGDFWVLRSDPSGNWRLLDYFRADGAEFSNAMLNLLPGNGGFDVWSRGTSIGLLASTTAYTADRWALATGTNEAALVSRQTGLVDRSQYCGKVQRNNAQTGTAVMQFEYPLDTEEALALRGRKVSIALVLKAGANWSPASGNIAISLFVGTGGAAKRSAGGYTGETAPIAVTQAITTTATRYVFVSAAIVPVNTTQASLLLSWTPVGTAGADDSFSIDDVMLVAGSTVPNFERMPLSQEILNLYRHLWIFRTGGFGRAESTTKIVISTTFPVQMRSAPATPSLLGTFKVRNLNAGNTLTPNTPSVSASSTAHGSMFDVTAGGGWSPANFTTGDLGIVTCDAGDNGVIFSSEI